MKLSTVLSVTGFGLAAIAVAFAPGCSSDEDSSGGADTGKTPPSPDGAATSSTEERTFAIKDLYVGDADRSGTANGTAWKPYGYNLDGIVTNVTDPNAPGLAKVCKRVQGAKASVHDDGDQGIDNAFGAQILPLIDLFLDTPSKSISELIQKGDFTTLLKVKGLTDDPAQTSTGLAGTILVASKLGSTPTFTTSDEWPYLTDPKVEVSGAYINKGTFVNSRSGSTIELSFSVSGQVLKVKIEKALITFDHKPPNDAANGTIAGVVATEALVDAVAKIAGTFEDSLCSGSTLDSIKDAIRQASDIMLDGTQDPNATCNAISIGLGFTAKRVANPTKSVAPTPGPASTCP